MPSSGTYKIDDDDDFNNLFVTVVVVQYDDDEYRFSGVQRYLNFPNLKQLLTNFNNYVWDTATAKLKSMDLGRLASQVHAL